ncbi:class I SAM-dependent RNA methyltransferase [Nocardia terpenica]|uniref:class I SAM-dependent RNA methyltransferase n=1 Tax=Nocardia terpenica TaxID=455432 RepID=UPI00189416F4|nr:TRAM domain-containing protein [Nocardia terpenica]MBF6065517.1 class I SAM-dependent RNA methyltransferase [Nocardia terpenica]MBF6108681.1 class I SAM-dependent RNA methyltransferase [Nocardia terpenica]MBF6115711.1 class I SAM-dependent RNA methyltransferase [Nocardia terpenica]MBF6122762.1 class I SAM-dependent RNA methyltransferase [Nocardia terpenica]MBF6155886.1 class I SAM-dependent RNA methyltransferase [Nocardia terpenica]
MVVELRLGPPGHGGFCVARHEGRVLFVRHGLPGELVRARVTEDRGKSFCRAEAVQILEASPDRVPATCPVSGPGGAGCCDFSFATPAAQRALKASVVSEQLRRLAGWETEVVVEPIPLGDSAIDAGDGWRTRIRLVADDEGRAGVHRYRSTDILTDLRCPQPVSGAMDAIADRSWTPGAELVVAVDGDGLQHIVELAPPRVAPRRGGDRRSTTARRAAAHAARAERVAEGSGRAVQYVAGRRWEVSATGFWQAHRGAAQCYSDVVAEWSDAAPGDVAWDLYCGAGVFAARLGERVGPTGAVRGVESARFAVADGAAALRDLPWATLRAQRVEHWIGDRIGSDTPNVVVLDPPRAGAGKDVIGPLTACAPDRIVHIGCDPASFARDIGLYGNAGYRPTRLRAFDAFPATHHVECLALLERTTP